MTADLDCRGGRAGPSLFTLLLPPATLQSPDPRGFLLILRQRRGECALSSAIARRQRRPREHAKQWQTEDRAHLYIDAFILRNIKNVVSSP